MRIDGNRPFSLAWWASVVFALAALGGSIVLLTLTTATGDTQRIDFPVAMAVLIMLASGVGLGLIVAFTIRDLRYRAAELPDSDAPRER